MNTKKIIGWDDILLNYKISPVHLRWICVNYNFPKGEIPIEFLESLICAKITATDPTKITARQTINFKDYKFRDISLPTGTNVYVPKPNLDLIRIKSLQLTDAEMKEQYHPDVTTEKVKFNSSERMVLAYDVDDIAEMKNLKRTEAELEIFRAEVNRVAAEHAAAKLEADSEE